MLALAGRAVISAPDFLVRIVGRSPMTPHDIGQTFSVHVSKGEWVLDVYQEQPYIGQLTAIEFEALGDPLCDGLVNVHLKKTPSCWLWVRIGHQAKLAAPPPKPDRTLNDVVDCLDAMNRRLDKLIQQGFMA